MRKARISRTKPLVRLILNQIGRHLTETLESAGKGACKHQLLMMLDEFPALGRLDFFETSLAFMAGYGAASSDRDRAARPIPCQRASSGVPREAPDERDRSRSRLLSDHRPCHG